MSQSYRLDPEYSTPEYIFPGSSSLVLRDEGLVEWSKDWGGIFVSLEVVAEEIGCPLIRHLQDHYWNQVGVG